MDENQPLKRKKAASSLDCCWYLPGTNDPLSRGLVTTWRTFCLLWQEEDTGVETMHLISDVLEDTWWRRHLSTIQEVKLESSGISRTAGEARGRLHGPHTHQINIWGVEHDSRSSRWKGHRHKQEQILYTTPGECEYHREYRTGWQSKGWQGNRCFGWLGRGSLKSQHLNNMEGPRRQPHRAF